MSKPIQIDDPKMTFNLSGGRILNIDPIDALKAVIRIDEQTKGTTNFEYLDAYAQWIRDDTGVGVTASEADAIISAIKVARVREKKEEAETLKSLNSTESTPAV